MNRTTFFLLLVVLVLFSLYLPINQPYSDIYSFKTIIDDWIPLITIFVTIYISYFVLLPITFFYLGSFKKPRVTNTWLLAIMIACVLAYIFYFIFQNSIVRPEIPIKNIFDTTYFWINYFVAPYNAFPSLHVAISTICYLAFESIKSKYSNKILIWVTLIIFSTVLTKQHYFLDIIGGLVLGYLSFKLSEIYKKIDVVSKFT